jgi:restriction system protein
LYDRSTLCQAGRDDDQIPTYDRMMNPLLQALRQLGGSGTIEEIHDEVIDILQLSDEQIDIPSLKKQQQPRWATSMDEPLEKFGIIETAVEYGHLHQKAAKLTR